MEKRARRFNIAKHGLIVSKSITVRRKALQFICAAETEEIFFPSNRSSGKFGWKSYPGDIRTFDKISAS